MLVYRLGAGFFRNQVTVAWCRLLHTVLVKSCVIISAQTLSTRLESMTVT